MTNEPQSKIEPEESTRGFGDESKRVGSGWQKTYGVWLPIVGSLIFTPFALLLALFSAGMGHGDYFWAKCLFPLTMLSTALFGSITMPFVVLAVIQFPLYGFLLAFVGANRKQSFWKVLLIAHLLAVAVCFLLADGSFS